LAISTLAGQLQITQIVGLALAVATLVGALDGQRGWRDRVWPGLALLVVAAVAAGLTALVLLPAYEYARLSPRVALSYKDAARYSLVPGLLGEMLVPALFGSREPALYWGVWDRVAAGYLGILPLIMAGLAVLLRRGRRVRLLLVLAVAAFLLALGGESVVHGWVYRLLPGFGQLRAPARAILLLDFGLAALAALGLDALLGPLARWQRKAFDGAWRGLLWLGGGTALIGGAWAYLVVYQAQDRDPTLFWRVSAAASGVIFALLMLGAGLAWLGARRTGRLRRRTLAWTAVGLVFLDLASVGAYTDLGEKPPTAGFDHPQVVEFLQRDPDPFRIDSRTDVAGIWQPDLALLAGLYDVGGVDNPLVVADVARYWESTGGRSTALYDLLGARYLLGSKEVVLDWDKFSLAFSDDPALNVYRNETALPRAFMVYRSVVAANQEDAWARIHEEGFDPATTVVVEGGYALDAQIDPSQRAAVQIVHYGGDAIRLHVDHPADGYLFLSDPFYPGWKARVDGEPQAILRANYAFRAIAVPAGTHQVTMAFQPGSWQAGLGISIGTGLILLVVACATLAPQARAKWGRKTSRQR
jgi:hypothetical protein